MGFAVSKSHVSYASYASAKKYERSASMNAIPDREYSLTFTGHILANMIKKPKKISYNSVCDQVMTDPFWTIFIEEIMRDSILSILYKKMGQGFYSNEYPPVSGVTIILDTKKGVLQNIISGTIFWKGVSTDTTELAECIAMKMLDSDSKNMIEDLQMNWSYHFVPGRLEFSI